MILLLGYRLVDADFANAAMTKPGFWPKLRRDTWAHPVRSFCAKTRNNPAQSGTASAAARRENVRGVYAPVKPEEISGKTILIVDDIITTGSTLSECAKILKAEGAKKILALTLARARD